MNENIEGLAVSIHWSLNQRRKESIYQSINLTTGDLFDRVDVMFWEESFLCDPWTDRRQGFTGDPADKWSNGVAMDRVASVMVVADRADSWVVLCDNFDAVEWTGLIPKYSITTFFKAEYASSKSSTSEITS